MIPYERKRQCESGPGICRNHARPDEAGAGTQGGAGEDQKLRHVAHHGGQRHGDGGDHRRRPVRVRDQDVRRFRRPDADGEGGHRSDGGRIQIHDRGCGEAGTRNLVHGQTGRRGHDSDGQDGLQRQRD
ncbi:hypothetical protein SDC9_88057 [bioreactor metagenome]|uniref:Uncharacterized protein n=1 Tax=bioreactor metagenome TaxID=1076179 RepID=A0A644ZKJ0_9ZZZZ